MAQILHFYLDLNIDPSLDVRYKLMSQTGLFLAHYLLFLVEQNYRRGSDDPFRHTQPKWGGMYRQ